MASGLFLRLQAQFIPLKMYGFEAVDRERERAIVDRLSATPATRRARPASASATVSASAVGAENSVCERYQTALNSPEPSELDAEGRHGGMPEEYCHSLYHRLGRSHTFSSRCKQRSIDPHRICGGPPGEAPDYQPIRAINQEALRPATPPDQGKQQLQRRLPNFAVLVGFSRITSRALAGQRSAERQPEAAKLPSETVSPPMAVFGALGRLRHRAKQEQLREKERERQVRDLHSDWEIVNATEFVRNYERENRRGMKLAVLARPTVSSRFKTAGSVAGGGCPLCREMPELAAAWQRRLATPVTGGGGDGSGRGDDADAGSAECPRCGHFHGLKRWQAEAEAEAEGTAAESDGATPEGGGDNWGAADEAALVDRLRAPTRASEGGVPFCHRGRRAVGPGLGSALLGFEGQRPKSAIERVRSAHKRKELIDAMTVRLHGGGGGGSGGDVGIGKGASGGGAGGGRGNLGGTFYHRQ